MPDDPTPAQPPHPHIDPERVHPDNAFDTATGYSGQDYAIDREEAEGRKAPSRALLNGNDDNDDEETDA